MSAANTDEPLLGLERNRPLHLAGRVRELRVLRLQNNDPGSLQRAS